MFSNYFQMKPQACTRRDPAMMQPVITHPMRWPGPHLGGSVNTINFSPSDVERVILPSTQLSSLERLQGSMVPLILDG